MLPTVYVRKVVRLLLIAYRSGQLMCLVTLSRPIKHYFYLLYSFRIYQVMTHIPCMISWGFLSRKVRKQSKYHQRFVIFLLFFYFNES